MTEVIEVSLGDGLSIGASGSSHITIGRDPANDIVISTDPSVSRRHAQLQKSGAVWKVFDLGSSNGTFVNGLRVRNGSVVQPGDRLQLGQTTLTLTYSTNATPAGLATMRPLAPNSAGTALSPRESEVLRLLAEGRTDQQIAEALTLSVRTVHSHLDRVRDKLGLRRRSELTRYAITQGLVPANHAVTTSDD